jgi:outer membrane immunogenic protein
MALQPPGFRPVLPRVGLLGSGQLMSGGNTVGPKASSPRERGPAEMEMRMTRTTFAAALAASTIAVGAAQAADIPRGSPPPPVVQALPIFTWTGFYVGLNGGYIFETGKSTITGTPGLLATGLTPGPAKTLGEGYTIGAQAGYNYQIGAFVAGIEADINYVDLGKTVVSTAGGLSTTLTQNTSYLATLRGRLGVAFDRVLIYGTGGLAMGDLDATTSLSGLGAAWTGTKSEVKFGYAVGAGLEYAITNNLSAKLEYLYYDLGKQDFASPQIAGAVIAGVSATTRAENKGSIARIGLNYRF